MIFNIFLWLVFVFHVLDIYIYSYIYIFLLLKKWFIWLTAYILYGYSKNIFDISNMFFIQILLVQHKTLQISYVEISGFCTTQDVDIFLRHMNNARYVRELDFARFHFYDRTGIYENCTKLDGHSLQGATTIRYRRTIPIFTAYKIETKVR